MNRDLIRDILERLKSGEIGLDEALNELRHFPFEDIGIAKIDSHRELRVGFPEVIFCDGKTDDQILAIAERMADSGSAVLATRISASAAELLMRNFPGAKRNEVARTVLIRPERASEDVDRKARVAIITAGTADIPVAEEAAVTCAAMGYPAEKLFDVGVAGIHRLTASARIFEEYDVFIVVAGMEGALASVVGGIVGKPVIAVPTSVGYGASFGGVAALLSMLNSCSSGITVVNIDSGFAAASAAVRILNMIEGKNEGTDI